jgi:nitrite reductase (NADH) small subunit
MTATSSQSNTPSPPARPEHYIGRLEDLPLHKVHRVEIEGRDIGIIRTTNSVHAIGNQCPHQGGPMCFGHVTGTMLPSEPDEYVYGHDGLVVRCPWHAYEFDIETGKSVSGVVPGRVPVFETAVRDGDVYCTLRRVGLKGRTP